jgi:hypothetical protein
LKGLGVSEGKLDKEGDEVKKRNGKLLVNNEDEDILATQNINDGNSQNIRSYNWCICFVNDVFPSIICRFITFMSIHISIFL